MQNSIMSTTMRSEGVGGQIHSFCAMNSFSMSFWIVPPSAVHGMPCSSATARYIASADARRAVHRHRRGDLVEADVLEERAHVAERRHGDALAADLAAGARVVGVVAHEGGHVEGGREARLALAEEETEARVGVLGGAEAGELAHRPEPAAVHARIDAARERELAGEPDRAVPGASSAVYSGSTSMSETVEKRTGRSPDFR
jgi:hypothetical protein